MNKFDEIIKSFLISFLLVITSLYLGVYFVEITGSNILVMITPFFLVVFWLVVKLRVKS